MDWHGIMDVLTWWFLNKIQMFAFHYVCVDCHLTFKLSSSSNADSSSGWVHIRWMSKKYGFGSWLDLSTHRLFCISCWNRHIYVGLIWFSADLWPIYLRIYAGPDLIILVSAGLAFLCRFNLWNHFVVGWIMLSALGGFNWQFMLDYSG